MLKPPPKYYQISKEKERYLLIAIILINLIIKVIPSAILELGNDEVYYWTYALFPDCSHFDHPPMVGLTIQLFSLNLTFASAFVFRLGSLILSSFNIFILYILVKKLYSVQAAFISTLLFTSSFYFNIISGLFILPDTPQIFFILIALYFGLPVVINEKPSKNEDSGMLFFGLFTGLAFLSKYHSLFLWTGFGLYVLFHNRIWLRKPSFYLSILITLITMIPVLYWNMKNNFISFTFHENRVGLLNSHLNVHSFLQFMSGQFFYQNPVVFVVFVLSVIEIFMNRDKAKKQLNSVLLWLALPMILAFSILSLFRSALPHWTGPAFICLIIPASAWLSDLFDRKRKKAFNIILFSNLLFILVLITGTIQISYGTILPADKNPDPGKLGKNDFTLDMYGWRQAGEKFSRFLEKEKITENDHENVKIISNKWFPAAHLDFYIAHPLNIDLLVPSKLEAAHKYYWINKTRRIGPDDKVYFITSSQQYFSPDGFGPLFSEIIPKDTIRIIRNSTIVKNLFIYEMKGYKPDPLNPSVNK
jgi:hypothetical protein